MAGNHTACTGEDDESLEHDGAGAGLQSLVEEFEDGD